MPTPYDGYRSGDRDQQPASRAFVSLGLGAESPHRAREEPEPAEEAENAGLEQRPEPLIVQDVVARGRSGRLDHARAEALAHKRLALPFAYPRTEVGKAPAATLTGLRLLLGHEPTRWHERVLDRSQRAWDRQVDHDQRRHECRPQAPGLARPKPQEHQADDDEHHDARP